MATLDTLKIYDPERVLLVFGVLQVQGFGESSFIKFTKAADAFNDKVGVDSEVARSKSNDRRADCSVTLMQTSSSNAALATIHNLDLVAGNGAGVFPLFVKDLSGLNQYGGTRAWIKRAPDPDFARETGEWEWVFRIAHLTEFTGGNPSI